MITWKTSQCFVAGIRFPARFWDPPNLLSSWQWLSLVKGMEPHLHASYSLSLCLLLIWLSVVTFQHIKMLLHMTQCSIRWNLLGLSAMVGVCIEMTFRGPSRSSSSGIWSHQYRNLTRMIAREDFVEFSRPESSRTYISVQCLYFDTYIGLYLVSDRLVSWWQLSPKKFEKCLNESFREPWNTDVFFYTIFSNEKNTNNTYEV